MTSKCKTLCTLLLLLTLAITPLGVKPAAAAGNTWIVNPSLSDNSQCTTLLRQCKTIQAAVDAASAGDVISIQAGTYVENVTVTKSLTLAGAGQSRVTVYPAISDPNCKGGGSGSLCTGSSNIILVQADDVTIYGLTLDGDNPSLTSSIVKGGADLDARNGIITNHSAGVYNNLTVYSVTVKNIYLRGMYASSGGTFNLHHNTVQNVQGEANSIAIMNFYGSGVIAWNTVSDANDAIASNWSSGTQYLNNTVTNSGSGVHSDNNGGAGGTADLLAWNTVKDCSTNGYGVWVFAPFVAPTIKGNVVENCAVGLTASGHNGTGTVKPTFEGNRVDGKGLAGSVGVYVTTDEFGWGYQDVWASFTANTIINNETGVYVEEKGSKIATVELHGNNISGNSVMGIDNDGVTEVDARGNWWGSAAGPGAGGNNGVDGPVTTTPFAKALITGATASTHEIGENGSLTTKLTVDSLYGVQFVVDHDAGVLSFQSGSKTNAGTAPNDWDWSKAFIVQDFVTGGGQTKLAATLRKDQHPDAANLNDASLATWTYRCDAAGTSLLSYDATTGTGTYLADRDGFEIPAALTGDTIQCIAATASVDGYIKLQGRLGSNPAPRGWQGAVVTLTCVSGGCTGYGPYVMTTDSTGHYQLVKSGPGSGVALGTYAATVGRRAYLGASKANQVTIAAGSNTINNLADAPTLLGGEVTGDGKVGIEDLTQVAGVFGTPPAGGADTGADINGDNIINIFDLVMVGSNYDLTTSNWP